MSGFLYLATPYSRYPGGLDAAFAMACAAAALIIDEGIPVFSPIAHSHCIAEYGDIDPRDHAIWLAADAPLMAAASALVVWCVEGWRESLGIKAEIAAFNAAGKPILFVEPVSWREWLPEMRSALAGEQEKRKVA